MIKKIDLYIIRKFLLTFLFIMAMINAIAIVIDLSEKIEDFTSEKVSAYILITKYYVHFVPYMISLLGPFFVFVAVIFFTSQMAYKSEITAILASGISFYRMLWPYFIGATILGGGLFVFNNYLVPNANKNRNAFEYKYVRHASFNPKLNFHRQISPDAYIYIERFNIADTSGTRFTLENIQNNQLKYKLKAEKASWLPAKKQWRLSNYVERSFGPKGEILKKGIIKDTAIPLQPLDLSRRLDLKEEMSSPILYAFIKEQKNSGLGNMEAFEIEYYRRTASAFSVYILTLIGVSLASRRVRGGMGFHIVMGITLASSYVVIERFSTTFSTNSSLPPVIGVWIPVFLYAIIAVFILMRAPK